MSYVINLSFFFLLLFGGQLTASTITVGNGGDFATLEAAESSIQAGDTVIVLDGVYTDGTQLLSNLNGTATAPIIIKSETQHGVVFQGGNEAIHLVNCSHLTLDGFQITGQTSNGINIDDGGDYTTPAHNIDVINCLFENMGGNGNNDFLKLSGLDSFLVKNCQFTNGGGGGSGVDMVGCHQGVIEDNSFDNAGITGIQAKGGSQHILMRRNVLKDIPERAVNLGGNTGLSFFRPALSNPIDSAFEAADLEVYSNVFIRSKAPIAYVGCVRVKVYHNTIYKPQKWVIRILQETTDPGFLSTANNDFINNTVYLEQDLTEVNIGPNTNPSSFTFSHNLWFNERDSVWTPNLPVTDSAQVIADPLFTDTLNKDFTLRPGSPAIGAGMNLSAPTTDHNGNNYNNPPSIGAYEGDTTASDTATSVLSTVVSKVQIFPNPAHNYLQLSNLPAKVSVQLYNVDGQLVRKGKGRYASSAVTMPVRALPNGIYFLTLFDEQKQRVIATRKVVIH